MDNNKTHSFFFRFFSFPEWYLNSPPKPHALVGLPLQSGFFNKKFVFSLCVCLSVSMFISVSYRYTSHFMLKQLDLFYFYPFVSAVIAMLLYIVITNLKNNKLSYFQLFFVGFIGWLTPSCLAYIGFTLMFLSDLSYMESLKSLKDFINYLRNINNDNDKMLMGNSYHINDGSSGVQFKPVNNTINMMEAGSDKTRLTGCQGVEELDKAGFTDRKGYTYPDSLVGESNWNSTWPNKAEPGQIGDGWGDDHKELREGDNADPKWTNMDRVNPNNSHRIKLPFSNCPPFLWGYCWFDTSMFENNPILQDPKFWESNKFIPFRYDNTGRTKPYKPYTHGGQNWPTPGLVAAALEFRNEHYTNRTYSSGPHKNRHINEVREQGEGFDAEEYTHLRKSTFDSDHARWVAAWLKCHRPSLYQELMKNSHEGASPRDWNWNKIPNTEKLRFDINRTR